MQRDCFGKFSTKSDDYQVLQCATCEYLGQCFNEDTDRQKREKRERRRRAGLLCSNDFLSQALNEGDGVYRP